MLLAPKRFSESVFWQSQPSYYQDQGVSAWNSEVPYHITSSTKFCNSYADMISSYMQDVLNKDPHAKFQIVELGAASGKFGYRLLNALHNFTEKHAISLDCLHYTMCDCADNILQFWQDHPQHKHYVDMGLLSYKHFIVSQETGVFFSGDTDSWKDRYVIVIANYFLDSIYHDAYCIEQQQVYPYLCIDKQGQPSRKIQDISFSIDKKRAHQKSL